MGEFPPWSSAPRKIRLSEYGFFGIEVAGERARIQALYDSLKNSGGEIIWDFAGTAALDGSITTYSKIHTEGLGPATKVKLAAGANSHVFTVSGFGAGGQDFYSFSKLWIDGNKAANPTGGDGIHSDGRRVRGYELWISNCHGTGLLHSKSAADLSNGEGGSDSTFTCIYAWSNDKNGVLFETHDTSLVTARLVANKENGFMNTVGGLAAVLTDVHAWGSQEHAFNFEGSFDTTNCQAEGATVSQVRCKAGGRWNGGRVFVAGTPENIPLFELVENSTELHTVNVQLKNAGTGGCFRATGASAGSGSILDFHAEGATTIAFTAAEGASFSGNIKYTPRFRGGATVGAAAPASSVASAATITIDDVSLVKVTGAAEVKKINGTYPRHEVTLLFTGTAKLVKGENLKLASTFEGGENRTLRLAFDGTNWQEVGRSANS